MGTTYPTTCFPRNKPKHQVRFFCPLKNFSFNNLTTITMYNIHYHRVPSLPCGTQADDAGYNFSTEKHKRASYFTMLEQMGMIGEQGAQLSMERWLDSSFFLPFKLSARTSENQYSGVLGDRILHKPTLPNNGKSSLYLRFKDTTTYVLRVTIIYKQPGKVAIDGEGKTWKDYDIGKSQQN